MSTPVISSITLGSLRTISSTSPVSLAAPTSPLGPDTRVTLLTFWSGAATSAAIWGRLVTWWCDIMTRGVTCIWASVGEHDFTISSLLRINIKQEGTYLRQLLQDHVHHSSILILIPGISFLCHLLSIGLRFNFNSVRLSFSLKTNSLCLSFSLNNSLVPVNI